MERVLRINPPSIGLTKPKPFAEEKREKNRDALLVAKIITNKVEPDFCHLNKFRRKRRFVAGEKHLKKYGKVFQKIYDFALEIRGSFKNNLDQVIEDYLRSVYERHAHYKSIPFMSHLSPTLRNEEGFLSWINRWENYYEESYWLDSPPSNRMKMKSLAMKHMSDNFSGNWYSGDNIFCLPDISIIEV